MHSQRFSCDSAGRVSARLLLSFLAFSSLSSCQSQIQDISNDASLPLIGSPGSEIPEKAMERRFTLRHVFHHGTYESERLHRRLDIPSDLGLMIKDDGSEESYPVPELVTRSQIISIQRLRDRRKETIDSILEVGRMTGASARLPISAWTTDDIFGPNITDKETVLSFARMAANAYVLEPHTGDWIDVGGGFNYTEDFGWENDGLRGHIFADTTNSTIVIGLKGTSPAVFDGSETTRNDKINDNLFFSCCCGMGGQILWKRVCDCQTSAYQCNSTCLVKALKEKNRYYYAARELYHNVTELYPGADVWMSGHSLGGAVSAMIGLTYGLPVVTFEAVPDAMPASRLGLPTPPGHQIGALQERQKTGAYHFGHTADPVYMGECNKASSICTLAGYAMQSVCHTGYKCVYDTVKDLGWRVGIGYHKIVGVIKDVIEQYNETAKCEQYVNCTDCFPWEFYESNGTETTTSSTLTSTSTSKTRTETCKTPGWWGCLDESTTTTSKSTTTTSTRTCETPGWWGCNDPITITTTKTAMTTMTTTTPRESTKTSAAGSHDSTQTTILNPSSSVSCKYPGWFGCKDKTTFSTSTAATVSSITPGTSSATCTSKRWFGLICVDPSLSSSSIRSSTKTPDITKQKDREDL